MSTREHLFQVGLEYAGAVSISGRVRSTWEQSLPGRVGVLGCSPFQVG